MEGKGCVHILPRFTAVTASGYSRAFIAQTDMTAVQFNALDHCEYKHRHLRMALLNDTPPLSCICTATPAQQKVVYISTAKAANHKKVR